MLDRSRLAATTLGAPRQIAASPANLDGRFGCRKRSNNFHSLRGMTMFDDKLTRARQLIEQRDQIDQELRVLFGELPPAHAGNSFRLPVSLILLTTVPSF